MKSKKFIYLSTVTKNFDTFRNITEQQSRLVLTGCIFANFSNFHHLAQLVQITRDQIKEGEFVEVLGALVAHFNDFDTTFKWPVAEETRKDKTERSEAAPTRQSVVNRRTRTRGVGTRFAASATRRCCCFHFVFIFALVVVATSSLTVTRTAAAVLMEAVESLVIVTRIVLRSGSAVVKEAFDAAEARHIVDTRFGRAETLVTAQPLGRQRARSPARLATAPIALGTNDGVTALAAVSTAAATAQNRSQSGRRGRR